MSVHYGPLAYPPTRTTRPTAYGDRWAVVGGHPLCTAVAAGIFESGGNAVDAGVAAGIAANVVQVDMCNFGGIAPMLIRAPGQTPVSIAGVGRWSTTANIPDMLRRFGATMPLGGAPTIVPGAPAAWLEALARFGTLSFADVAAPAIELAERGFVLDDRLAMSLERLGERFAVWESSAAIFRPGGAALLPGARLCQPALAELLRRLVTAERSTPGDRRRGLAAARMAFYDGDVAERIVTDVRERGGFLTRQDLRDFVAEVEAAPFIDVRGWRVYATQSWSQGPVALAILGILDRMDPDEKPSSAAAMSAMVDAIGAAFGDREAYLAAPDAMRRPLSELLDPDHLAELAAQPRAAWWQPASGSSTTAVVTMDRTGLAFACTPSDTLDTGPIIAELGILCSTRGLQSRLDPAHPNALEPGRRPCVTPSSLIALRPGRWAELPWAMACPGGDVIVQAMAQVFWNAAVHGLTLQESVEAPRLACQGFPGGFHPHSAQPGIVKVEARVGSAELAALGERGHTVQPWPDWEFNAGSVQTIRAEDGPTPQDPLTLVAAADPRRLALAQAR